MKYKGRPDPNARRLRLRNKRLKNYGLLLISLVLLAAIWVVVDLTSSPSKGHQMKVTIKVEKVTTPTISPDIALSEPTVNNYFVLNIPLGYKVQPLNGPTPLGEILTEDVVGTSSAGSQIIAIAIYPADGGLNSNSSYELRVNKPSQYQRSTQNINGQTITVFSDNQTSNLVAFWPHGSVIASISASSGYVNASGGGGTNPELAVLNSFLNNWHWQQ